MVTMIVNEVTNQVTLSMDMKLNDRFEVAEYYYALDEVYWEFRDERFIFEKRLGLNEFEHKHYFNLPQNDVYIKYLTTPTA